MSEKQTQDILSSSGQDMAATELGRLVTIKNGDTVRDTPIRKLHPENASRKLNNGHYYVVPDAELVAAIEKETNGKVTYFPTDEVDGSYNSQGEYSAAVIEPIARKASEQFAGKMLALRSIATSINGRRPGVGNMMGDDEHPILDAAELVKTGVEKPGDVFNVAIVNPAEPTLSLHRVSQYASAVELLRMELPEEDSDSIFPAVLVYDAGQLQKAGGSWAVSFREGVEPRDALLAAYIVDCPDYSRR